ncbi:MAG: NTP transferase domain-containing protein, partial [Erysipelotrichaceae bacterium]|nr:NTP transferase domain-containing protein [Erysipelotrichaceae bacterium]
MYLSLGGVNALFSSAAKEGLIDISSAGTGGRRASVTEAGLVYLKPFRMDGAVIMAAGFGSRFRPLTFDTPKGLLKVLGERMLERQIRQLHEAGITDITL